MKTFRWILILFTAAVLFTGCIQIQTKLFVKKDGSGTITERVMMSKTFVNMLTEFARSFQDSTSEEEFTIFKDDEVISDAKNFGEDVSYVSHEYVSDENWEGYSATYSFKDVSKIKLSPDPDEKVDVGIGEKESEQEEEYYYFKFNEGEISELVIDRPEIEIEATETEDTEQEESEESDDQEGDEFSKMMEGMNIKITVEVEGDIVNTNANYVEGSEITLIQMDFGEMMKDEENFKEFTNKEPSSIEEMKEFLEKFPGMKLETEKPVRVKFK
jgi:hypothetical protein